MKKVFVLLLLTAPVILQFCSSSKNIKKAPPKMTYATNVQPMLVANCTPCHFPPKGNKKPLDTYVAASKNIDDMIARVQRNPTDKGFMPFKHAKLADSTINVLVRWKADGLLEK